jgi:hypothetical protein
MKTFPSFFGHDLMWGAYFTTGHMPDPATFGLVRLHDCGVSWNEIHKGPGQFKWDTLDQIVAKLPGKKIVYTFARTPQWASMRPNEPGPCGGNLTGCGAPPADVDSTNAHWKEFVTVLATRYKGRFDYEGWNEANGAYKGAFWTGTTAQLVRMQSDAYAIIKSIDPTAMVAGPSVDGESNQFPWLDGYLAAGGNKYQDAVTFHAYLHDLNSDPAPTLTSWLAQFRALKAKHGIASQELWQTEGSWAHGTLGAGPLTPDQQAAYTMQSMIFGSSAGVSRWVHYSYDNVNSGTLWNGTLLPAGKAYAELYGWLVGAELTSPATKAADGTWSVGLTLASGQDATISWKPNQKPILETHGGAMNSKVLQIPVAASTTPLNLTTDPGMVVTQNGNDVIVTNSGPSTITGVSVAGPATLQENATAVYADTVTGTGSFDPSVTWKASDGSISQAGVFTAPPKVEDVVITAMSVQDPTKFGTITVSIAQPSNTVKVQPTGGDDTAGIQTLLNSTASTGKILELQTGPKGAYNLSPLNLPTNTNLLIDPGVLLSDRPGYGGSSCMLNVTGDNVKISATGATLQMPNSFAQSMKDGQQWRHGVSVRGNRKNPQISGLLATQCGGDGFMFRECTGLVADKISASKNYRNGLSITGQVNDLLVSNSNFSNQTNKANAGIAAGLDIEPNVPSDFIENVRIESCVFNNNQQWGLYISLWFLNAQSQKVTVDVSNCQANNNGTNYMWSNGQNTTAPHSFTGSGNLSNGHPITIQQMFPGA